MAGRPPIKARKIAPAYDPAGMDSSMVHTLAGETKRRDTAKRMYGPMAGAADSLGNKVGAADSLGKKVQSGFDFGALQDFGGFVKGLFGGKRK